MTVISIPLPLPRLEPDDWEKWWYLWNTYSMPLHKIEKTPNKESGLHVGFDVYSISRFRPCYQANFVDFSVHYPYILEQIMAIPVEIYVARFVMSRGNFPAHIDNSYASWQIRNMFYCRDPSPQWYYTDMENKGNVFLNLPRETNWWAYKDGVIKHGTVFREQYPKIILQLFTNCSQTEYYIETILEKYPLYSISFNL